MKSQSGLFLIFSHPSHRSHFWFLRCSENNSVSRKINRTLLLMAFNCIFSFPDVRPWKRGVKRNSGPSEKLFWHRQKPACCQTICYCSVCTLLFVWDLENRALLWNFKWKILKLGIAKAGQAAEWAGPANGHFCLLWQLMVRNKSLVF